MEHGRLLYLSLKKIMLNIFKVIIKTTNLNNCVKNRDSTWVTESVHLLKHYIYLFGKFDFVDLLYLSEPFNSCGPFFPAQHLITS